MASPFGFQRQRGVALRNMPASAREVSRLLGRHVESLVLELLPAGKREGAEWRVGSLAGEPGRSLGVHLHGARAGVWADFASGETGDALDLVAAVLYRGDKRQALVWARRWLGLDATLPGPAIRREPALEQAVDRDEAGRRSAALRIFLTAQPTITNTPAAEYLRARGIDLAELARQPRALRFHPALYNMESRREWPALVAACTDAHGNHVATHRTWLVRASDGRWTKAPLRHPKMTLGRLNGATIRLWRGASGKSLRQMPSGEPVVIGEGIETCLSIAVACPELRVLCGVSLANMGRIVLPATATVVILAADNDGDNSAARQGLQRAIDHFLAAGKVVRIARSPVGKDFNDCLLKAAS